MHMMPFGGRGAHRDGGPDLGGSFRAQLLEGLTEASGQEANTAISLLHQY